VAAVRVGEQSGEDSGTEPTVTDTEARRAEGTLRGFGSLEESRTWVPGRFAGPRRSRMPT
jgi:hypothetical protein